MSGDFKRGAADRLVGRKIGSYTITRCVGQGGMGMVYEAQHERLSQRAAVKVLHQALSADQKLLDRFFNEAKAISLAQHSSIVKIFDFGQLDDGTAYIMMEFLEGETLLQRLQPGKQAGHGLPLHQVVEWGRQLAAALDVSHQKGVVHRDLKPENIFLVPDPVAPLGERVKLLDFGIAKFLEDPAHQTTVGMILGTPLYMSPEQCEGSEGLDAKVDVYALGVMLYEMLVGRLPFSADTSAALMRQHMFKEPPLLAQQVGDLPVALTELVHRMLAKQPATRPTMLEVFAAMEELLLHIEPLPVRDTGRRTAGQRIQPPGGGSQLPDPFGRTQGSSDPAVASGPRSDPHAAPLDPFARTLAEANSGVTGPDAKTPLPDGKSSRSMDQPGANEDPARRGSYPPLPSAPAGVQRQRLLIGGLLVLVCVLAGVALRYRPTEAPLAVAGPGAVPAGGAARPATALTGDAATRAAPPPAPTGPAATLAATAGPPAPADAVPAAGAAGAPAVGAPAAGAPAASAAAVPAAGALAAPVAAASPESPAAPGGPVAPAISAGTLAAAEKPKGHPRPTKPRPSGKKPAGQTAPLGSTPRPAEDPEQAWR